MAASSRITTNFATMGQPDQRRRSTLHRCLQVRAQQGFGDEGRSKKHIDDANLRLLRDRMEVVRIKESLERCFDVGDDTHYQHAGWNGGYAPALADRYKHRNKMTQSDDVLELLVIVCRTFGITVLSGTLCLCLVSVLVHLNH
ncbi:uncharacterized protein [Coffea arabica]|uniref:Uncharacterized protein n=1 Tax=Coffea arabica TaxID=13443 RepID=A0ABM4UZS6_COFAR